MQTTSSRPFLSGATCTNATCIRRVAPRMVTVLCLIPAIAGCQSHGTDVEAQSGAVDSSTARTSPGGSQKLKVVALPDPSFGGMPASFVAVPAGWQVYGQMVANPCTNLSFPAWNATSSDSQSQFNVMPQFGWRWGSGAQYGRGCISLNRPMNAEDFLQQLAGRMQGMQITGTMPIAPAFRSREEKFTERANRNSSNTPPMLRVRATGDVAAVRATDSRGYEMRLRAWVQCRQRAQGGDCFAKVDILRAPKGRLDALAAQVDNHNLIQDMPSQEWQTEYMNHQQQVAGAEMNTLRRNADASNRMLRNQFLESSARLNAEHQAGLEQIERQGHDANRNAMNDMNMRSTIASDWRDYAADQQTVSGANGTYKTSSAYTNVWSSPVGPPLSDGRTFGSTDNTLDPNSATDNTWTQDHKVHGNGQSY